MPVLSVHVCFFYFVFILPADGLVGAETCRRNIINDKCLFVIDYEICWIEFFIYYQVVNETTYARGFCTGDFI